MLKTIENSLQSILLVENESDIYANDLQEEFIYPEYSMKSDVSNYLCPNNLITLYPNRRYPLVVSKSDENLLFVQNINNFNLECSNRHLNSE